jgi:hypothetical protein
MNCRLCDSPDCRNLLFLKRRDYYFCGVCGLIFVPASQQVPVEEERRRYDLHDNSPDHEGYRTFLNEVADLVVQRIDRSGRILDFGCGRHAVLTSILRERGFDCTAFDPLYGIGMEVLSDRYDTVVLCEVIEHMREVKNELRTIKELLNPCGTLVIQTRLYTSLESFDSWWYKNDITHINFFGRTTIDFIAREFGYELGECGTKDTIVLVNAQR